MRWRPVIVGLAVLITTNVIQARAHEFRTWTGRNGIQMEAKLVREEGDIVVLEDRTGKELRTRARSLIDADGTYLKSVSPAPPAKEDPQMVAEELSARHADPGGDLAVLDFDALLTLLLAPGELSDKDDLAWRVVREGMKESRNDEGAEALTSFVASHFKARSRMLESRKIPVLSSAANGILLLRTLASTPWPDGILDWLITSNDRVRLLAEAMHPDDDHAAMVAILHTLYEHDPAGRDHYVSLILALATVWDQPRPLMHHQMGSKPRAYDRDITARYDYFTRLYGSYARRASYSNLDVATLRFVVDTPLPVSELEWALTHVKGSVGSWGKKFSEIDYDHPRLDSGEFSWPHGPYTLGEIEKRGGICVDQAYYAAMTARAHGIPAIYFSGQGRRGGHAWFAYMKGKTGWELEVGRYAYDKYATGHAKNPQTNKTMTDHDVEYTCESSLNSRLFSTASAYVRVAGALMDRQEYEAAAACAGSARKLTRKYAAAWDMEVECLERMGKPEEAVDVLALKAQCFKKYPDIATQARERQAALLRASGQDKQADRIMREQVRRVEGDRDDLATGIIMKQIDTAKGRGNPKTARRAMEKLLADQIKEGNKLRPLIRKYLKLTQDLQQTHEAARFMRGYTRELLQAYGGSTDNKKIFLSYLLQAYTNDHDKNAIRKTQREIDRL